MGRLTSGQSGQAGLGLGNIHSKSVEFGQSDPQPGCCIILHPSPWRGLNITRIPGLGLSPFLPSPGPQTTERNFNNLSQLLPLQTCPCHPANINLPILVMIDEDIFLHHLLFFLPNSVLKITSRRSALLMSWNWGQSRAYHTPPFIHIISSQKHSYTNKNLYPGLSGL